MRHRKHRGSLSLPTGHRRALLANLAGALITKGRIQTTEAKARALRPYVEKLITLGKRGDLHARRQALAKLRHRSVVDVLFSEVAPVMAGRNGGYTRIIKAGFRVGDAAPMAVIELVRDQLNAEGEQKAAEVAKSEAAAKAENNDTVKASTEERPSGGSDQA